MTCKSDLLPVDFPHHEWRTEVTSTSYVEDHTTDMWGRTNISDHVTCHKHEVCARCGETRNERECMCDLEVGERCAIRIACLQEGTRIVG